MFSWNGTSALHLSNSRLYNRFDILSTWITIISIIVIYSYYIKDQNENAIKLEYLKLFSL